MADEPMHWTDEARERLTQLQAGSSDELIALTRRLAEQHATAGGVTAETVMDAFAEALQTRSFNSVYRAFRALSSPGVTLTPEQMARIKQHHEGGQTAQAQRVILDTLAAQPKREPIPDLPADEAYARLMDEYGDVFEARRQRHDEQEDEAE